MLKSNEHARPKFAIRIHKRMVNLVKSRMMNLHSRDTFDCVSTNREIETEFETIERILYWQIKAWLYPLYRIFVPVTFHSFGLFLASL